MAGAPVVRYCGHCLMPDTRPRIGIDADGICNACRNAEEKQAIDWPARREEFLRLLEQSRPREGAYDCVVPWSGGKDSSAIAHRLKFEFGMNPLLVTFSPLLPNETGARNRELLIQQGFDHIFVRPNQKVSRALARRFFVERGNPRSIGTPASMPCRSRSPPASAFHWFFTPSMARASMAAAC
jgi:hypothetical protein